MRMRKAMMLVGLLAAVGCGSDSFQSSVPGGKPLNELSADEAFTLCTEAASYTQAALPPATLIEYECRSAGVETALLLPGLPTDAQTRDACRLGYDACKRNPPTVGPTPNVAQVCAGAMGEFASCQATVDTYVTCLNEALASIAGNLPPCNQLTTLQVLRIATDEVPQPPTCQVLAAVCPTVASDDEAMSSALKLMKR